MAAEVHTQNYSDLRTLSSGLRCTGEPSALHSNVPEQGCGVRTPAFENWADSRYSLDFAGYGNGIGERTNVTLACPSAVQHAFCAILCCAGKP